jgi:16S rRNA (cytidine1402-2'-O)-methyltransferase
LSYNGGVSTLYIVATPIGNMEDISLRALRVLREVKLIAAEDTRKTRRLLNHYDVATPLTSYYEHNKLSKLEDIMRRLEEGDVALVSDAGMPGISDPGYELVAAAVESGFQVVPIPGASAIITALAASGLPTDRFCFLGFLPNRKTARRKFLEAVAPDKSTIIVYEAPHRIPESLADMLAIFGDRHIAACRELTKLYEEIFRGTISEAIEHFEHPRGEFTLVIEGNTGKIEKPEPQDIEQRLESLRKAGKSAKQATIELAAETGIPKKELYRLWLKQK